MVLIALVGMASPVGALDGRYERTLILLCDALLATQLNDPASPDDGALVCPSLNPERHPLHSRGGEAVYPLALAFRNTGDVRYRDAAVRLGRWLISIQQPGGAWGENSPRHDGWTGTTADQLLSLAGALPMLRSEMTEGDRLAWERAISRSAEHVVQTFPISNIHYQPTGAVALLLAARAVSTPPARWLAKADALVETTFEGVNADGLLVGEGMGVDVGYNLAQSIGYLALFGILKSDAAITDRAAALLRAHLSFIYPNGSIDNSWGTRSYKWTYESGTKTAPGVYFSLLLLADRDPSFGQAARLCLDYLMTCAMNEGRVSGGPHAGRHESLTPPCLYGTFTRAQSLALAIAYAPTEALRVAPARIPAQSPRWVRLFPTVNVAVVRTGKIMATVSAYGGIERYGRELVSRGGSVTNVWYDGFGRDGFVQTSSATVYRREERIHMPDAGDLLPLTPRIECTVDGTDYTNLFEAGATIGVDQTADHIAVATTGLLLSAKGESAGVRYTLVHRFFDDRLTKEFTIESPRSLPVRIVEPFVKASGLTVRPVSARRVALQFSNGAAWDLSIEKAPTNCVLVCGRDDEKYWCPFPAVECYPVTIEFTAVANEPTAVHLAFASIAKP